MAARVDLEPLPPFDPLTEPSSIAQRWKTWKRRFETYLVALNVTEDKQKRALLLYQAGQSTQEIFDMLPGTGDEDDYETAMTKLNEYFSPKKNVDYEIFQFRQAVQNAGETVDQFATRLRKLAAHCEFPNLDRELKSAIIQNCQSKRLRRYALREDALTLDGLLSKARALEASETQATGMEKSLPLENVNWVQQDQGRHQKSRSTFPNPNKTPSRSSLKLDGTLSSLIVVKTHIENPLQWRPPQNLIEKAKKATKAIMNHTHLKEPLRIPAWLFP